MLLEDVNNAVAKEYGGTKASVLISDSLAKHSFFSAASVRLLGRNGKLLECRIGFN